MEALAARPQLGRRLRPAEHQHGEQRELRLGELQRLVQQVAELHRPAARAAREPCPAAVPEPLERGADLALVVVGDRVAVGRLVRGEAQRVQRERVLVGRRPLLLDQAAEHPQLDGIRVHCPRVNTRWRPDDRPGSAARQATSGRRRRRCARPTRPGQQRRGCRRQRPPRL